LKQRKGLLAAIVIGWVLLGMIISMVAVPYLGVLKTDNWVRQREEPYFSE